MKAVWPRASLRVIAGLGAKATGTSNGIIRKSLSTSSWVCQQCQHRSQQSRTLSLRPDFTQSSRHDQRTRFPSRVSTVRYESTSSSPTTSQHDAAPPTGRSDLPSQSEGRRSHISKRFTYVMDNIQSRVFIAGQRINDLTGYSGIEALKKDIEEQESAVQNTRKTLRTAKEAYTTSISLRSASQREVNELLQRKHAWSPQDLERFTALYRSDHTNSQTEAEAEKSVVAAEKAAEEAAAKLNASILARYHEEQIWSDKIRRMSTWGTWGLMGVNVLLFLVFQIGVEPWRRRRLVKGFEEKVVEALEKENKLAAVGIPVESAIEGSMDAAPFVVSEISNEDLLAIAEALDDGIPMTEGAEGENSWQRFYRICQARLWDLFSERAVSVRKIDLTARAIEGTLAGIAICNFGWHANSQQLNIYSLMAGLFLLWVRATL